MVLFAAVRGTGDYRCVSRYHGFCTSVYHATVLKRTTVSRSYLKVASSSCSVMYVRQVAARMVRSKRQLLTTVSLGTGLILGFTLWMRLTLVSPQSSHLTCGYQRDNLVYVGVMTARKHLDNRVVAAQETWVRDLPGKAEFFSSSDSSDAAPEGVSVVALPGVTDAYPPMKKSFLMLKYMYDHYVERYDWFIRADDDVYIKGDRLERFLRGLDPSEPLAVGQPGFGRPADRAAMRFTPEQNYCMGGPGVVLSRETLRRVGPRIQWCLKNLYSIHDDVEFGRCFYNVANVSCSRAYDCKNLFLNNYEGYSEGSIGEFATPAIRRAITLHPNKLPENQYRFHMYLLSQRLLGARHRTLVLSREIGRMTKWLSGGELSLDASSAQRRPLSFLSSKKAEKYSYWEYFSGKQLFTVYGNLRFNVSRETEDGLRDVIAQYTDILNPDPWKTSSDVTGTSHGYRHVTPGHGVQYVLDLTTTREGRNTRQRVRLSQAFLTSELAEMDVPTAPRRGDRAKGHPRAA